MPAPVVPAPIEGGRSLGGRYRLVERIARGGMAEVWEAHDEVLSRPVAVKILQPHLATDGTFLERFRREAVAAARLAHPGVVATFDTGVDAGTAYIVMELVRGRTLRQVLAERGRLPPALAASIAAQIADALAHAHRAGLVHRDVKPANVLLADEEWDTPLVKVTDFGIAKAHEGVGGDLTRTGMVLGTPKYLSPEQIEGFEPDARADLYALGVVLYEMLVGAPPFVGATDMATAIAHVQEEPPRVATRAAGVPPELDQLVADLLVKDREQRLGSAASLRRALLAAAGNGTVAEAPGHEAPGAAAPGWGSPATTAIAAGVGSLGPGWEAPSAAGPAGTPPVGSPALHAAARPAGRGLRARRPDVASAWADDHTVAVGPPTDPAGPGGGPPGGAPRRRRRRGGVGVLAVVGALVVAGAVLAGVLVSEQGTAGPGTSTTSAPPGTAAPAAPIAIRHVDVYLPVHGHPLDDPQGTPLVFDGNPATAWHTDQYANPTFGNYYPGIGLAIDLGSPHRLTRLRVTSPTVGWAGQAYVSDHSVPTGQPVSAWGTPTATHTGVHGDATFDLGGRTGRWVLLWITNLGPGDTAAIAEVSVT